VIKEEVQLTELIDHVISSLKRLTGNQRNRSSGKPVMTEGGPLRIVLPRDRDTSFEALLIPKYERRFTGLDDEIIAMHACDMTFAKCKASRPTSTVLPAPPAAIPYVWAETE